jgi:hypothetical protein
MSRQLMWTAAALLLAAPAAALAAEETSDPEPADGGVEAEAAAAGSEAGADAFGADGATIVRSGRGTIVIGAFLQAGYEYLPDEADGRRNSFALHHAALAIEGTLAAANLSFGLAGDTAAGVLPGARRYGPGGEARSEEDVPFITDAALTWRIPAIGAAFRIGRFVPSWGLLMPERPTRLGAISYPLYVHGNARSLGRFRNLGLEARVEVLDWLAVEGGVFNGGVNSFADADDYKDILVGVWLHPASGLEIRASAFFAFAASDLTVAELAPGAIAPSGAERHIQPILEARYRDHGFDLIVGGALDVVRRADHDTRPDYLALGAMGHLGYMIVGDWLELFARVDIFDPSDLTRSDEQLRLTAGPQFHLDGIHGQIRVNYMLDRFGGALAMCATYLEDAGCADPLPGFEPGDVPPEAKRYASTVILQFGVDI